MNLEQKQELIQTARTVSDVGIPASFGASLMALITDYGTPIAVFITAILTAIWAYYRIVDLKKSIELKDKKLHDKE
jgi:hypothetical protein